MAAARYGSNSPLTFQLLLWTEVLRQGGGHVHTHVVGHGGGDDVKDVGRLEGVEFGLHDRVYRQDVNQGYVREIAGAGIRLVEGEAFGVQSPIVFLALNRREGK